LTVEAPGGKKFFEICAIRFKGVRWKDLSKGQASAKKAPPSSKACFPANSSMGDF
jgi:hypothetical protein